jgi:hypothetical protein
MQHWLINATLADAKSQHWLINATLADAKSQHRLINAKSQHWLMLNPNIG